MKELLEEIDVELGRLKEGNRLKSLIGELKTELIGKLLTTVQLVEKKITSPEPSNNGGNRSVTPTYAAILKTNAPQAKPVPSRDLREIRVKRENLTPEEADKPVETLVREINNRPRADSADTKTRAEAKKEEWIGLVSAKAEVRPKKYTVLVHGTRGGRQKVYEQNPNIKGHIEILRTHWKRKLKEVELFDPQCLVTRCYYTARSCRGSERCGYCAAPGHSQESCSFKDQENKQRCKGNIDRSRDQKCPKQEEAAREVRPRFFAVPKIPPPINVQYFETTQATGKRQAEETPHQEEGLGNDFFSQSTPHSSSQASTSTTEEPRDSEMEDRSSTQTWN
ncbi:hypothetical protein V8E54_012695 [Elaphomyces granulatus]